MKNEEGGNSVCTVVLRGSTDSILDDTERAVDDGVNTYKVIFIASESFWMSWIGKYRFFSTFSGGYISFTFWLDMYGTNIRRFALLC